MLPFTNINSLATLTSRFMRSLGGLKGLRWFALAFALIQLWMLFWAGFVAGMALTGDWL